mmetsp:Transcript_51794/g.83570  ORF Transcript_51794/g.83570 Transcript_51794/m.83570 type:complete len:409 (+) Transcript_51794:3-1229(+)
MMQFATHAVAWAGSAVGLSLPEPTANTSKSCAASQANPPAMEHAQSSSLEPPPKTFKQLVDEGFELQTTTKTLSAKRTVLLDFLQEKGQHASARFRTSHHAENELRSLDRKINQLQLQSRSSSLALKKMAVHDVVATNDVAMFSTIHSASSRTSSTESSSGFNDHDSIADKHRGSKSGGIGPGWNRQIFSRPSSASSDVERTSSSSSTESFATPSATPRQSQSAMSKSEGLAKATWSSFQLFQGLSKEQVARCIDTMKVKNYAVGQRIITKGTVGTKMYFIDVGAARASINGVTANEFKSGEYFGEIAFVSTCKKVLRNVNFNLREHEKVDKTSLSSVLTMRQADVYATAQSRMLEFSVKDLLTALKGDLKSNEHVLASLSRTSDVRLALWNTIQKRKEKCPATSQTS